MARPPTYYDQLGVARNAPDEVIRGAYKALALKHHPDKNINNPAATTAMQAINQAYAVLSDPHKRAEYDAKLDYIDREERARMRQTISDQPSRPAARPVQPQYAPAPSGRGFTVLVVLFLAVAAVVFFVYLSMPPSLRPSLPNMANITPVITLPKPAPAPQINPHDLAVCVFAAAKTYSVPPPLLLSLISAEGGSVGKTTPAGNSTYDLGLMQINSTWVPQLTTIWSVTPETAWHRVLDDACLNLGIGAWILQTSLAAKPTDLRGAIAIYRASAHHIEPNKISDEVYISKVLKLAEMYKSVRSPEDLAGH